MTEVEPANAQLGDTVKERHVWNGSYVGSVVGVDTQGPAVLVRWEAGAMDVYSVDSPAWGEFVLLRETPEQPGTTVSTWRAAYQGRGTTFAPIEPTETFETVYDGHQPGTERYAIEVPPGFEPVRDADGRATGIAPVLTLPWGNDNGA